VGEKSIKDSKEKTGNCNSQTFSLSLFVASLKPQKLIRNLKMYSGQNTFEIGYKMEEGSFHLLLRLLQCGNFVEDNVLVVF